MVLIGFLKGGSHIVPVPFRSVRLATELYPITSRWIDCSGIILTWFITRTQWCIQWLFYSDVISEIRLLILPNFLWDFVPTLVLLSIAHLAFLRYTSEITFEKCSYSWKSEQILSKYICGACSIQNQWYIIWFISANVIYCLSLFCKWPLNIQYL